MPHRHWGLLVFAGFRPPPGIDGLSHGSVSLTCRPHNLAEPSSRAAGHWWLTRGSGIGLSCVLVSTAPTTRAPRGATRIIGAAALSASHFMPERLIRSVRFLHMAFVRPNRQTRDTEGEKPLPVRSLISPGSGELARRKGKATRASRPPGPTRPRYYETLNSAPIADPNGGQARAAKTRALVSATCAASTISGAAVGVAAARCAISAA